VLIHQDRLPVRVRDDEACRAGGRLIRLLLEPNAGRAQSVLQLTRRGTSTVVRIVASSHP